MEENKWFSLFVDWNFNLLDWPWESLKEGLNFSDTLKWSWTMHQKTYIFYYFKNFGQNSLTCVTRLKVAVNMSDPICLFGGTVRMSLIIRAYSLALPIQVQPVMDIFHAPKITKNLIGLYPASLLDIGLQEGNSFSFTIRPTSIQFNSIQYNSIQFMHTKLCLNFERFYM